MTSPARPIPIRTAAACGAATLVVYVGIVHEVVGARLYPDGPARFGGPLGWHAAGAAAIVAGLLLGAGILRMLPIPVRALAATVGLVGVAIFIAEVLVHGGFHFFAFTLVVATGFLIVTEPGTGARGRDPATSC